MAAFKMPEVVVLKGGVSIMRCAVERVIALEARGATFELLEDGGVRIVPASVLTEDDVHFLCEYREEVRRAVRYKAPPM